MKKTLALLLALLMVFSLAACGSSDDPPASSTPSESTPADISSEDPTPEQPSEPAADAVEVMSYEEYIAAELDTPVVVEAYVQAKQSWWDNKATIYTQDKDGAYFIYDMACSEEDYAKLTIGTKIRVTGYKSQWAGEVEIVDATCEILDGSYIAAPVNATNWLGTDELIAHQNELVTFTDMTVEPSVDADGNEVAFLYRYDGSGSADSDSDLYFNVSSNGQTYNFLVEYYVCDAAGNYGADTEVYKSVQSLKIGDKIDLEGFLYWYEGANTHITAISVVEE